MPRPRLRGWFHEIAFLVALPAAAALIAMAPGLKARLSVIVYGIGICALYGVSAAYHRGAWSARGRRRMKRLDHGTIFVMIAATYTPVCLLVIGHRLGTGLLIGAWLGAAVGMTLAVTGIAERRFVGFICYLTLGWLALIGLPAVLHSGTPFVSAMLIAGGVVYTAGTVVLASRRPNPFPKTFGYHEVWHTMVIAASACHYLLVLSLLRAG